MVPYISFVLGILVVSVGTAEIKSACVPGEVSKPYTFTFSVDQSVEFVPWTKDNLLIASCTSNECSAKNKSMYAVSISGQSCSLTILNVTVQSSGSYSCGAVNYNKFTCDFTVFEKKLTCSTGEVSKPYTFTFIVSQNVSFITWQKGNKTIADCIKKDCESRDPMYAISRSGQSSSLTILNVTVHNSGAYMVFITVNESPTVEVSTIDGDSNKSTCDFTVFAKPEHVICQDAEFQVQTNEVKVVCTAQRVYPYPKCQFTWTFNGTMSHTVPENLITYDNTPPTGNYDFFKAKCSVKLPARNFFVGSHQFQVRVYPNVTGGDNDTAYGIDSIQTSLQFVVGPTIFNFEANNNSQQIIVERNSIVLFSCQAEGNPLPRLSLRKNGTELAVSTDTTQKPNQTFTYSKVMAECLDTGVYTCLAVRDQTTTNKTVAVYVKCKPEFRNSASLIEIHQVRVNGTVSIYVPVFGYPEPNVTVSSTNYTLSSDDYRLAYLQQEPPYGSVLLTMNITNANYFQIYNLAINNTEGLLIYSFEIVDGDPGRPDSGNNDPFGTDVGAIVGGIVAAVLVLVIIFVIIFFLKRKGASCNKKQQNDNTLMHTPYSNESSEGLPQVQATELPQYEEIIDVQYDMSDRSDYFTNQITNIRDEEVQYANTV